MKKEEKEQRRKLITKHGIKYQLWQQKSAEDNNL